MEFLLNWTGWESLAPALLHTLWIGALVAVVLAALLRRLPAERAELRTGLTYLALMCILLGGIMAWAVHERINLEAAPLNERIAAATVPETNMASDDGGETSTAAGGLGAGVVQADTANDMGLGNSTPSRASGFDWRRWIVAGWLIGVMAMLLRMGMAVAGARRMRAQCQLVESPLLERLTDELIATLGIARRVTILVGDALTSPAVVGVVRPAILWPAAWLVGLDEQQLRAILAHELAHIRRHDYLFNLLQMLAEALLFFNPVVWWISGQIRREREACCDALARRALGEGAPLAHVLADLADGLGGLGGQPAVALADGGQGNLLDRVRRLLDPGHRPAPRLPWPTLLLFTMLTFGALAGMKQAGDMVVRAIWTHEERMEYMTMLEEQYEPALKFEDREYTEEDNLTIKGVVRTADGAELPKGVHLVVHSQRPGQGATIGLGLPNGKKAIYSEDRKSCEFNFDRIHFGEVHMSVTAEGYASAFVGPYRTEPAGMIEMGEIVLERGGTALVQVVDGFGKPLEGVGIKGQYEDPQSTYYVRWKHEVMTDGDGMATFEHLAGVPMTLEVQHPGFEQEKRKGVELLKEQTYFWELTPARLTQGLIVSAETGEPVEGASIQLFHTNTHGGGMTNSPENAPEVARTDAEGRFEIDWLRADSSYQFIVRHEAHRTEKLGPLFGGLTNARLELGPPLYIEGRVLGLDKLSEYERREPKMRTNLSMHTKENSSYGVRIDTPLEVDGDTGTFRVNGLWEANEVHLRIGSKSLRYRGFREPIRDVVIDLNEAESNTPAPVHTTRTVVFRLMPPAGAPMPKGNLTVEHMDYVASPNHDDGEYRMIKTQQVPIAEDGTARIDVPLPCTVIRTTPEGMKGYWFSMSNWWTERGDEFRFGHIEEPGPPVEIPIQLHPAGSIAGRVFEADGSPSYGLLITAFAMDRGDTGIEGSLNIDVKNSAGGRSDTQHTFHAGPLPLGWTYRVVPHRGGMYLFSDPIKLTEDDPFREITLRFREPVEQAFRLVDERGRPLVGIPVSLSIQAKGHGFGSGIDPVSGPDGRFSIPNLLPGQPKDINTQVQVNPKSDYQPLWHDFDPSTELETIILPDGHKAHGRVVEKGTGKPVVGMEVYAQGAWDKWWEHEPYGRIEADSPTDEQGRFEFTRLADRDYNLNVRGGITGTHSEAYPVTADQEEEVVIEVDLQDWWLRDHPQ